MAGGPEAHGGEGRVDGQADGVGTLARAASKGGAASELLVSNYSESLGDFSPGIGTALLSDRGNRHRVDSASTRQ